MIGKMGRPRCMALGLAIVLLGCTSTRITHTWTKPETHYTQPYSKILVVALISDAERSMRSGMETHLVNDLQARGISAYSAMQTYGPKRWAGLDEKQLLSTVKDSGYDAILTVVLLSKERERYYVPGRIYYSPYIVYHRRFWGYYSAVYERIYEPGYYSEKTDYFWESNFFRTSDQELLCSIQTQSFDPENTDRLCHEYGQRIAGELIASGTLR